MAFKDIADIAGSAMAAQTVRLNTIASNLANADSVAGSEADTYRARKPVFAAVMSSGSGGADFGMESSASAGGKVQVLDVVQSDEPLRKVYEPGHPMANADGMVFYPNVNQVAEMTDMMSASRAFQSNVEVLSRVQSMQQSLLKLGQG
jgi:flagellar basal-body rod protein FlgC